jgi:heme/copper-type cytochrome/quinol oxidase subunit 2
MSMKAIPGMETNFSVKTKVATEASDSSTSKNMLVCVQICGANHFKMKMEIKIAAEKDYSKWLDSIQ